MLEFRPCTQGHIDLIMPQHGHVEFMNKLALMCPTYAEVFTGDFAMSVWKGLRCLGAGGLINVHPGRTIAWSLLGADAGPYMREITQKVKQVIDGHKAARIEMTVDCDFEAGHRWAKILGFKLEAERMQKYGVAGNDEAMYVRIRD